MKKYSSKDKFVKFLTLVKICSRPKNLKSFKIGIKTKIKMIIGIINIQMSSKKVLLYENNNERK